MNVSSIVPTVLKFIGAIIITVALLGVGFTAIKNLTKAGAQATENAFQAGLGISVDTGIDKTKVDGNTDLNTMGGSGLGDLSGFNFN